MLFVSLSSYANEISITQKHYLDSNNELSVEEIYKLKEKFTNIEDNSFGLTGATLWIYVKVENLTKEESSHVIELPYALLDYVRVMEYKNQTLLKEYLTGDLTSFDTREVSTNDFVIPYELEPYESKEFILKVDSAGALNVDMKFMESIKYHETSKRHLMVLSVYYGAVIIMLIYNFILYLMIKERVYLHYVNFHLAYFFLQLGLNGLAFEYFFPNAPQLNVYYVPFFLILSSLLSVRFSLSFLEHKRYSKPLYWFFNAIAFVSLVVLLLVFFVPYFIIIKIIAVLIFITISTLFFSGAYFLYKYKTTASKFYVIAWGFFLGGISLTILQNFGVLPMSFITQYGSQIGAFIELSLLSFALAHKYNVLFLKLEKTEASLRTLNKDLESKVMERTEELAQKQKELLAFNETLKEKVQEAVKETKDRERLLQGQSKLAAMGEMINNIAHQWRQPLAVSNTIVANIQMRSDLDRLDKEYLLTKLKDIERTNLHMSQTIEDFMSFFNPKKKKERFNLKEALDKTIMLLESSFKRNNVEIICDVNDALTVNGYKEEYVQVVLSILVNSMQAFSEEKDNFVILKANAHSDKVTLLISDNAGGIPTTVIDRIFEPYFTTKNEDKGTGLGLYISKMIIETSMHGSLLVQNIDEGVEFSVITKS